MKKVTIAPVLELIGIRIKACSILLSKDIADSRRERVTGQLAAYKEVKDWIEEQKEIDLEANDGNVKT